MAKRTCSIDDCNEPHEARGWCIKHYRRWQKYGDPLGPVSQPVPDLPGERWRPVPDWEGLYDVSDLGRVRSLPRPCLCPHPGALLTPWMDRNGYLTVTFKGNGRRANVGVHQLVAAAFIGPRPEGQQVRHGPNGKLDNRASQLCYGTRLQNKEDEIRDGTRVHGNNHYGAKLTAAIVAECKRRHAAGETQTALAREFGVSVSGMNFAVNGATWSRVELAG